MLGFRWNEDRTPANGPAAILSAGCQAFSRSWVWTAPGVRAAAPAEPMLGHGELFRPWWMEGEMEALVKAAEEPDTGLGLRLLVPGLPMFPELGRDAVLSGVGLQVDSFDSSSSDEERFSPDFLALEPLAAAFAPLELAARSCLRNLARRFWNQT